MALANVFLRRLRHTYALGVTLKGALLFSVYSIAILYLDNLGNQMEIDEFFYHQSSYLGNEALPD